MRKTIHYFIYVLLLTISMVFNACNEDDDDLNLPPNLIITSPADQESFAHNTEITFSCTATDIEDGAILAQNILWSSNMDGDLGNGPSLKINTLSVNTHKIILSVYDSKQNINTDTITIHVYENTKPIILITFPKENTIYTSGNPVVFKCIANDMTDGELSGNSVTWKSDFDGEIGTGTEISTSTLSVNKHHIIATATNSKGEINSDTLCVEIIENLPPTVNITSPSENEEFSEIESIQLTCTATDTYDGELPNNSIHWLSSIDGELGTGKSLSVPSLSVGTHKLIAFATDSEENTWSDTISVLIYSVNKLDYMLEWMTGSYSSHDQSETSTDPYHFDVRRETAQIWTEETNGFWLYLEQAYAGSESEPYFQRVYHFFEENGVIKNVIYKLNDQESYVGSWATPSDFDKITTSDLTERENCGVTFTFTEGHFYGSTSGKDCLSTIPGILYMTSEQWIYENHWDSWDLGWSESDVIVMGPYSQYIFDKIN